MDNIKCLTILFHWFLNIKTLHHNNNGFFSAAWPIMSLHINQYLLWKYFHSWLMLIVVNYVCKHRCLESSLKGKSYQFDQKKKQNKTAVAFSLGSVTSPVGSCPCFSTKHKFSSVNQVLKVLRKNWLHPYQLCHYSTHRQCCLTCW